MTRFITIIFFSFFVTGFLLQAQIDSIIYSSEKTLSEVLLPPVDVLFQSARNNPRITYYDSRNREEKHDLRSIKVDWLNYIRLTGGYQYGHFWTNSVDSQLAGPVLQTSKDNQSYYNAGVAVVFPLDQIVDRRNRINKQKEVIKQTELEIQRYWEEQKMLIADAYTEAQRCLGLLKVRSEALMLAETQYRASMDDFAQNKINASDLSRMKNMHSNASGDYELIMSQLKNALIRLEILSGYKILK